MKILLVGDTNVQNRTHPSEAFSHVRNLIDRGDVKICQAEGLFTESARHKDNFPLPYKDQWVHSTPEMLNAFRDVGFDALSMASNVSFPAETVLETLEHVEKYSLRVCGVGKNISEARKPVTISRQGVRISLLSRTSVFWPHLVPATMSRPGAATLKAYTAYQPGRRVVEMPGAAPIIKTWPDDTELGWLLEDIKEAKKETSCVILSMHWGVSGDPTVHEYQRIIARAAINAGANIVFGHHPHEVSQIEIYRGSPIFYSLGNFAFDWEKMQNRILYGIVIIIDWDENRQKLIGCSIVPVSRMKDNIVSVLSHVSDGYRKIINYLTTTISKDQAVIIHEDDGCLQLLFP